MRKLFAFIALFGLLIPSANVFAEAEFNPHYIISDQEMQDTGSWKTNDVQTFLESKGSYLANFRCEDVSSTVKTAAEIIYDAAIRNQISPKFLLVTLQKEQSLITDDSPSQRQLDWATGFAVCDGCELANPKVQKYKGFGKQVDGAASIIRWYYDNQAAMPFIKKKDVSIYIDDEPVIPQTWATAFLYTYTPHLHGNKNFWRIWNTWFSQFYPNGTIVQSSSSTDYWLIAEGKKRRFKSMTALITRSDPKMAVIMSEADLKNYPDGPEISFPNYSVIKAPSGYYLIDYDTIRPFASADTVSKIGYNPQEILDVSESDLAGYTRGSQIGATTTAPQGVIYRITDLDSSLYLFKDNTLFPITNPALLATNFKNLSVENRTKKDILKFAVADQPVKFADGALLKIKGSSRLYVIENGKKRRMADEQTFLSMGYKKENLVEIDLVNSLNIPEGDPIYVNNALASAKNKYLGDSEAPISDLFATKLPAYLVAEYPSGKILSGKSIDKQRPIASLVKILTAYEAINQDFNLTKSTVFNAKKHVAYNNPLLLVTGEKLKNKDILYSALVASVNNAARMIGLSSGLTENSFIAAINTRLEEWGADNTKIADTTGLSDKNVSTPRDLLKIFVTALKNSTIKETMSQTQYTFKELLNKNKIATHNIKNTNQLMFNSNKPYRILASKTGYTDEAGAVLVMLIESKKTKKQYVILTMGNSSANRFVEPNRLATWAINSTLSASIAGVKKIITMPLVFAAITPHPPILIPNIGRGETKKLAKTTASYNTLEEELYASHPDVIIIISPHGSYFPDVFTLNFCSDYTADFKEFGDIETKLEFKGDFEMAHRLRDATKRKHVPAAMISEPRLDHGSAVPLYFLTNHLPGQKIVQLGFCNLDYKTHVDFGQMIKEQVFSVNRRIAVIASGDLSHALSTDAPAGYNKNGPEFDAKIREMLMNGNYSGLPQFENSFADNAAECGLRSILILLGILQGVRVKYRELSYEAPFGVGYLTASFTL